MPTNILVLLVQLILFLLTIFMMWRQGRPLKQSFALPAGRPLRNGDIHEWLRLLVQIENVRRPV